MTTSGTQTITVAAVALVAWFASGLVSYHVSPEMEQGPSGLTQKDQERVDQAASSSLFGQFRSSTADFLWLKVDRYIHGGVELRGMTDTEMKTGDVDRSSSADGNKKQGIPDRENETPVIPSARRDWRGKLGDLEREVMPYQDMTHHTHRDPKEALPLFRLMTWSNPHFISGYTVGAAMIARDPTRLDEAINFLLEGEKNNPDSIEIAESLGEMYMTRKRQLSAAMPYLERAISLGHTRDQSTMTDDEKDGLEDAYRWIVLNCRNSGNQKAAKAYAEEGLRVYPDDVVCREYLQTHK